MSSLDRQVTLQVPFAKAVHIHLSTVFAYCALASAASAEAPFNFGQNPGMLPKTVIPSAYRIELTTDPSLSSFTGHEDVDIAVAVPTSTIILNQNGLKLSRAVLAHGPQAAVTTDDQAQTAVLRFPPPPFRPATTR